LLVARPSTVVTTALLLPHLASDMLLDALFNPERPPNPQYRDKYIWILAYAVSVVDVGMYAAIMT
jgi:hypothetical protein